MAFDEKQAKEEFSPENELLKLHADYESRKVSFWPKVVGVSGLILSVMAGLGLAVGLKDIENPFGSMFIPILVGVVGAGLSKRFIVYQTRISAAKVERQIELGIYKPSPAKPWIFWIKFLSVFFILSFFTAGLASPVAAQSNIPGAT